MQVVLLEESEKEYLKEFCDKYYQKIRKKFPKVQGFQIRYNGKTGEYSLEPCTRRPYKTYYLSSVDTSNQNPTSEDRENRENRENKDNNKDDNNEIQ